MTVLVKIKSRKARRILEDLASLNIIEISGEPENSLPNKKSGIKQKTLTYLASEASLSKTWDNPIEDKAWQSL